MDPSNQGSQIAGEGTVIRDSTNAAIVIGIVPFKKSVETPPVEIAEAQRMIQWLTAPDGGQVPQRSLRFMTSSVLRNGDVTGPDMGDIETAFRETYAARASRQPQNSLVTNRLYIVVTGHGFGDREGRVTLLTSTQTDERIVGLETHEHRQSV